MSHPPHVPRFSSFDRERDSRDSVDHLHGSGRHLLETTVSVSSVSFADPLLQPPCLDVAVTLASLVTVSSLLLLTHIRTAASGESTAVLDASLEPSRVLPVPSGGGQQRSLGVFAKVRLPTLIHRKWRHVSPPSLFSCRAFASRSTRTARE